MFANVCWPVNFKSTVILRAKNEKNSANLCKQWRLSPKESNCLQTRYKVVEAKFKNKR